MTVRLTRGLRGEWISRDGRWHITPIKFDHDGREWRVTDTFKRIDFGKGRNNITVPTLYQARALINSYDI